LLKNDCQLSLIFLSLEIQFFGLFNPNSQLDLQVKSDIDLGS